MFNSTAFTDLSVNEQMKSIENDISSLCYKLAFFTDKSFNTDTFYKQLTLFHNRILFQLNKR